MKMVVMHTIYYNDNRWLAIGGYLVVVVITYFGIM